ncbi:MAG: (2Fe-2S)-binding protein [Candidatus Humimicrobiaceae bacterium]
MSEKNQCSCCSGTAEKNNNIAMGEYVCYCNKVSEADILKAIQEKGATSVDEVIKITGAMVNSNCKVNNPKGTCCYPDIVQVFNKYKK